MTQVLTLKYPSGDVTEVHMLNPGERFPRFGGSRHDLIPRKTASLVLRRHTPSGMQVDTELDIHDAGFWTNLARLFDGSGVPPVAVIGPAQRPTNTEIDTYIARVAAYDAEHPPE